MNRISRFRAALAAALLVFGLTSIVSADGDSPTRMRLRARLTGQAIQGTTPEGNADFRSESGRMRLQVEVENVNLPPGTMLAVSLQHGMAAPQPVGQITLSATGFGELELDSQDGATVPPVQSGDVVSVTSNGAAILAGAFGPK